MHDSVIIIAMYVNMYHVQRKTFNERLLTNLMPTTVAICQNIPFE